MESLDKKINDPTPSIVKYTEVNGDFKGTHFASEQELASKTKSSLTALVSTAIEVTTNPKMKYCTRAADDGVNDMDASHDLTVLYPNAYQTEATSAASIEVAKAKEFDQ